MTDENLRTDPVSIFGAGVSGSVAKFCHEDHDYIYINYVLSAHIFVSKMYWGDAYDFDSHT